MDGAVPPPFTREFDADTVSAMSYITPKRVLVTGGSGYVGQFLLDELAALEGRVLPAATYLSQPHGI
jgi:hypothetical protein